MDFDKSLLSSNLAKYEELEKSTFSVRSNDDLILFFKRRIEARCISASLNGEYGVVFHFYNDYIIHRKKLYNKEYEHNININFDVVFKSLESWLKDKGLSIVESSKYNAMEECQIIWG